MAVNRALLCLAFGQTSVEQTYTTVHLTWRASQVCQQAKLGVGQLWHPLRLMIAYKDLMAKQINIQRPLADNICW